MRKKGIITTIGFLGACALCCALPLLGGAVAIGLSSFLLQPWMVALLAAVLMAAGIMMVQRRKKTGAACQHPRCNCGSCSE